jgi:hypothetical protein
LPIETIKSVVRNITGSQESPESIDAQQRLQGFAGRLILLGTDKNFDLQTARENARQTADIMIGSDIEIGGSATVSYLYPLQSRPSNWQRNTRRAMLDQLGAIGFDMDGVEAGDAIVHADRTQKPSELHVRTFEAMDRALFPVVQHEAGATESEPIVTTAVFIANSEFAVRCLKRSVSRSAIGAGNFAVLRALDPSLRESVWNRYYRRQGGASPVFRGIHLADDKHNDLGPLKDIPPA